MMIDDDDDESFDLKIQRAFDSDEHCDGERTLLGVGFYMRGGVRGGGVGGVSAHIEYGERAVKNGGKWRARAFSRSKDGDSERRIGPQKMAGRRADGQQAASAVGQQKMAVARWPTVTAKRENADCIWARVRTPLGRGLAGKQLAAHTRASDKTKELLEYQIARKQ